MNETKETKETKEKRLGKQFVLDPTVGDLLALKGPLEELQKECAKKKDPVSQDAAYYVGKIVLAIGRYEAFLKHVKKEWEEGE